MAAKKVNRKAINKAIRVSCKADDGKHEASVADVRQAFKGLNEATDGKFYKFLEENFN